MNDASKNNENLDGTDPTYDELARRSADLLGRYEDLLVECASPDEPVPHGCPKLDEAWAAYKAAEEELNAYLGEKHQDACQ